jgi:hypothetical protein
MRSSFQRALRFLLLLGLTALSAPVTAQDRVVDRIVARVEGDIILWSEVQELGKFQQLVEGAATSEQDRLNRLIEQWIVRTEMDAAGFRKPSDALVSAELEKLVGQFDSPEAFAARLRALGASREMVSRQLAIQHRISLYLDYKFRPAVMVDEKQLESYYRESFVPELARRGEHAPPLDEVRERIRELLTQREITIRVSRWLDETRARLRVEILHKKGAP